MSSCPNCGFPLGPHPFDPSLQEEPTTNEQQLTALRSGDELNFGKYKGRKVDEVLTENPGYIIWINENVEWLAVDSQLLTDAWNAKSAADDEQFYRDDGVGWVR